MVLEECKRTIARALGLQLAFPKNPIWSTRSGPQQLKKEREKRIAFAHGPAATPNHRRSGTGFYCRRRRQFLTKIPLTHAALSYMTCHTHSPCRRHGSSNAPRRSALTHRQLAVSRRAHGMPVEIKEGRARHSCHCRLY